MRSEFIKTCRNDECSFKQEQLIDLEIFSENNLNHLGEKLKQVGSSKREGIPLEVYDDNGDIVFDKERVLEKWQYEYDILYNNAPFTNQALLLCQEH